MRPRNPGFRSATLGLALLLVPLACGPASEVAGIGSTLAGAPDFVYRVVGVDDAGTKLEVKLVTKTGTELNYAEVLAITLGGVAPTQELPVRLGPAFGGEVATQILDFPGVRWEEDRRGRGSDPVSNRFQAAFTYSATISHSLASPDDESSSSAKSSTSRSNLAMPIWIEPGTPLHTALAARAGAHR